MNNMLMNFAQRMIQNNPNLPNAPWVNEAISAIMNNDEKKGEQIANNLCQSFGTSREEALKMARERLNLPF